MTDSGASTVRVAVGVEQPRTSVTNRDVALLEAAKMEAVPTSHGTLLVHVQGDPTNPAVITVHDIGLNYRTCFGGMFSFSPIAEIFQKFCVYHIDLPGQELGAEDRQVPNTSQMTQMIADVAKHFHLSSVIGLGCGAGAYLLLQLALSSRHMVRGLILIGATCRSCGWVDWAWKLADIGALRWFGAAGLRWRVVESLVYQFFSEETVIAQADVVQETREAIASENPQNLLKLLHSFNARPDLSADVSSIPGQILLMVGEESVFFDEAVHLLSQSNKERSSWIKIPHAGHLVQEERPEALVRSIELFLLGL